MGAGPVEKTLVWAVLLTLVAIFWLAALSGVVGAIR